jgi:1,4-alpha-glucan branching enzyme
MYELDHNWTGFEWINADDADRSIFSFIRKSKTGKNNLLFVCNFTPVEREDYRVGVPTSGKYKLVFNSDDVKFGGSGVKRPTTYTAAKVACDGRENSFAYALPAYGVAIFSFSYDCE